MTRDKLAATLQDMGLDWSRFTVNRLEIGRRENVSVIELLALCAALDISPVDLLVLAYLNGQLYRVAPRASALASNVREWIRGEKLLYASRDRDPDDLFEDPAKAADIAVFVQFMPEDRARRVVHEYFEAEWISAANEQVSEEAIKKGVADWLNEHGIGDLQ
jgi:DNA-binding Xre family transcriptional regulator